MPFCVGYISFPLFQKQWIGFSFDYFIYYCIAKIIIPTWSSAGFQTTTQVKVMWVFFPCAPTIFWKFHTIIFSLSSYVTLVLRVSNWKSNLCWKGERWMDSINTMDNLRELYTNLFFYQTFFVALYTVRFNYKICGQECLYFNFYWNRTESFIIIDVPLVLN